MSNKMNPYAKGLLLGMGAYIVTMGVTFLIISFTVFLLWDTHNCGDITRALAVLLFTVAFIFIGSIVVVRVIASKVIPGTAGRRAIVIVYALLMLASYIVVAFGLMVAFNC